MENSLNVIYAVVLSVWSFRHPDRFVIGYLVYVSSYGGWMSNDILIGGVEYGQFLVNVSALFPMVMSWKEIPPALKKVILVLALFYLYGLMKPVVDGHQGWMLSVKSSKSVTAYFFLFYVLAFCRRLDWNKIFCFLTCLSLYYAILYIVNRAGLPLRPPLYVKGSFIQCPYDSFLLLAFCYQLAHADVYGLKHGLVLAFLWTGICMGGYFSLAVVSLCIGLGVWLYRSVRHPEVMVLLTGGLFLLLVYGWYIDAFLMELWQGQQSALDSRGYYNEFRWALIAQEFWGGYGFLSRDTRIVSLNALSDRSSYMSGLSFVDAGYVDLMGRFGLIGTLLFLLVPLYFVRNTSWNRKTLPFVAMVVSFYFVNITWSVFSFPQGIIVLALAYAYLYMNKKSGKWQES